MPEPIAEAVIDVRANTRPFADDVRRAMDERRRATRTMEPSTSLASVPGGGMAMRAAQSPLGIGIMAFSLIMRASMRAADELEKLADAFQVHQFTLMRPELAKAMAAAGVPLSRQARQEQEIARERGRQPIAFDIAAARATARRRELEAERAGDIGPKQMAAKMGQESMSWWRALKEGITREARPLTGGPTEPMRMLNIHLAKAAREAEITKSGENILAGTRVTGGVAAAGTMGGTVEYTRSGPINQLVALASEIRNIIRADAGLP